MSLAAARLASTPGAGAEPLPRPDLSVIVVTHGGREAALETLRSARAATGALDCQWIVVDSASPDDTPDAVARDFPEIELVRVPNRGFAAANNVGLARARGRYVLLLNPDVEMLSGDLEQLVTAMDARPALGLASVVQRGSDGALQPSIRRFPTPARDLGEALFASRWPFCRTLQEPETRPERYAVEGPADWLVGAFLIARREAIADVGPLDERFFLYSEEIDWCRRFGLAGWRVGHLPVIEVTHHGGRRWRADMMAQLTHSRLLFAHKHYGRGRALGIRLALALGHAVRLALLAPGSLRPGPRRARSTAEVAGLAVAMGLRRPPHGPYSGNPA